MVGTYYTDSQRGQYGTVFMLKNAGIMWEEMKMKKLKQ